MEGKGLVEGTQLVVDVMKGHVHNYVKERVYLQVGKWAKTGSLPISLVLAGLRTHKAESGAAMVSVYDSTLQLFIYLGTDPASNDFKIPLSYVSDGIVIPT